jgi:hypothetical protein
MLGLPAHFQARRNRVSAAVARAAARAWMVSGPGFGSV